MMDIVEDALDAAGSRACGAADAAEFGPPAFAVVGCGPPGVERAATAPESRPESGGGAGTVEFDVTTVGVGAGAAVEAAPVDRRVTVPSGSAAAAPDAATVADAGLAAALADRGPWTAAVVTAHAADPAHVGMATAVCRALPAATTTVASVTVPPGGLPAGGAAPFRRLVGAADTSVPFALGRVERAFGTAPPDGGDGSDGGGGAAPWGDDGRLAPVGADDTARTPGDVAEGLFVDLAGDLFHAFHSPFHAPVAVGEVADLLDAGGIALACWGWTGRAARPAGRLADAVARRCCGGAPDTADGGLGFLRFGAGFTLREFERLDARARRELLGDDAARSRWVLGGAATAGLGARCRLLVLLTGVDAGTLPFLGG